MTFLLLLLSSSVWRTPVMSLAAWPVLAQVSQLPDPKGPEAIGWWLLAAAGVIALGASVVGLLLGIWTLIEKVRGPKPTQVVPQPLQVSAVTRFATYEELQQVRQDLDEHRRDFDRHTGELSDRIEKKFDESVKASNVSASKTHGRIDDISKLLHEMRGEIKHISAAADAAAKAAHEAALSAARVSPHHAAA